MSAAFGYANTFTVDMTEKNKHQMQCFDII